MIVQSLDNTVAVKAMAGEDDWDSQGMGISDYPVLKQKEEQGGYKVYLYPDTATSTALGFALNYTVKDPVLKNIFNDLRFRQRISLAIDRNDISQTIFLGKTTPLPRRFRPPGLVTKIGWARTMRSTMLTKLMRSWTKWASNGIARTSTGCARMASL
jgi:ABC-type transport system substrate-binding protein